MSNFAPTDSCFDLDTFGPRGFEIENDCGLSFSSVLFIVVSIAVPLKLSPGSYQLLKVAKGLR